jgi:hypothetical protein
VLISNLSFFFSLWTFKNLFFFVFVLNSTLNPVLKARIKFVWGKEFKIEIIIYSSYLVLEFEISFASKSPMQIEFKPNIEEKFKY